MDLIADIQGNLFLTGFVFNSNTNSNDIITIKFNTSGNIVWDSTINNIVDDKGYAIDVIYKLLPGHPCKLKCTYQSTVHPKFQLTIVVLNDMDPSLRSG